MSQEAKDILANSVDKTVATKSREELRDILYGLIGILSADGGFLLAAVANDLNAVQDDQLKYIKTAIEFIAENERECVVARIKILQERN